MHAGAEDTRADAWQRAAEWERLASAGRLTVRVDGKQLALFLHEGRVHACNNRCPHEGYPLVEGSIDGECVLTCHWHNWKFDLATGANQYGGDALRIYPVKVEAGAVWVDARDPPAEARIAQAQQQLADAMADHDAPRIARELARLGKAGATPERALTPVLLRSHERFRYGMTHAYGAAEAWLRLRDSRIDDAQRLACAAEVFGHIAHDTLREPACPFSAECRPWNAAEFEAAVEAQDEPLATSLLNDALPNAALLNDAARRSLSFADLEPSLRRAALAHFNDFGHSLIYLTHLRGLIHRLGPEALRPLLLAWLRGLVFATREDLLPDFCTYGPALSAWPAAASIGVAELQAQVEVGEVSATAFTGHSVRDTLAAVVAAAATAAPLRIHHALMEAAALHLLRFDTDVDQRADNPVADNVGWLDFTHAITFGQAVRVHCSAAPELWPQGLLQLAMFVGRNSGYLSDASSAQATLQRWAVPDAAAFDAQCIAGVLDHGLAEYIYPAHLLKTWTAVRDEVALGVPDATAQTLRAAENRLFGARFKQRHVMRTARQALGFVGKED
jgi:nitrite reductase/ring-hydroxylating ferredoxin subunit